MSDIQEPPAKALSSSPVTKSQWSSGLYDCFDDPYNCFISCFFPCITMGQIVEIVDKGSTPSCVGGAIYCSLGPKFLYGGLYRSKLRALFSLPERPHADYCLHCCCCLCAMTQEYRELKSRGVDPEIGWEGNVEKWKSEGVIRPPIAVSGMNR